MEILNHFPEGSGFFIASHLERGEENAIPTAALMALCGYTTKRALQDAIHAERERGALILSTCGGRGGYFLPSEGERGHLEVERYVCTLTARGAKTLDVLRPAREFLRQMDGQLEIETEVGGD